MDFDFETYLNLELILRLIFNSLFGEGGEEARPHRSVSELGRGFFFGAGRQLLTFDFEIFLLVKS